MIEISVQSIELNACMDELQEILTLINAEERG
jgi:hypothetical protein